MTDNTLDQTHPNDAHANDNQTHANDEFVLSYHRVRQALGFLGLALPFSLILGALLTQSQLEPSISDFYSTTLRDIFVGNLSAIGIFLITYKGYRRRKGEWFSDDWIATIAGLAAFGVAFFPNENASTEVLTITQVLLGTSLSAFVHYASATTLFSCFAIFCYVKFPKTAKPYRRRIYLWCGHVIVFSTVMIVVTSYLKLQGSPTLQAFVIDTRAVFWFEAIGIWAFAFSWLVKGKADMSLGRGARKILPATLGGDARQ